MISVNLFLFLALNEIRPNTLQTDDVAVGNSNKTRSISIEKLNLAKHVETGLSTKQSCTFDCIFFNSFRSQLEKSNSGHQALTACARAQLSPQSSMARIHFQAVC